MDVDSRSPAEREREEEENIMGVYLMVCEQFKAIGDTTFTSPDRQRECVCVGGGGGLNFKKKFKRNSWCVSILKLYTTCVDWVRERERERERERASKCKEN